MLTLSDSATNELSPVGALEAFKINDDGSVTSTDSISSQGNGPAFTVQLSAILKLSLATPIKLSLASSLKLSSYSLVLAIQIARAPGFSTRRRRRSRRSVGTPPLSRRRARRTFRR